MASELGILGIARKAGRLEVGEEPTGAAARAKKAKVILLASDASENTADRAGSFAFAGGVPLISLPYTKYELGLEVGKGETAMLAVTDAGLAASFVSKLADADGARYAQTAFLLSEKAQKMQKRKKEAALRAKNSGLGKRRKNI